MLNNRKVELEHGYIEELSQFLLQLALQYQTLYLYTLPKIKKRKENDGDITNSSSYLLVPFPIPAKTLRLHPPFLFILFYQQNQVPSPPVMCEGYCSHIFPQTDHLTYFLHCLHIPLSFLLLSFFLKIILVIGRRLKLTRFNKADYKDVAVFKVTIVYRYPSSIRTFFLANLHSFLYLQNPPNSESKITIWVFLSVYAACQFNPVQHIGSLHAFSCSSQIYGKYR